MTIDMRDPGELEARTSAWISTELGSFSFGDVRLSKRGLKLFECLAAQPQHSISHAMGMQRAGGEKNLAAATGGRSSR